MGQVKNKLSKITKKSEKQLDNEAMQEDSFSILFIILVLILCFAVGITLGICLYRIAINSSNAIIMSNFLR